MRVGDRVMATCNIDGNNLQGKYGVVIAIHGGNRASVEFDVHIGGHNCHGRGKNGHCWFCGIECLLYIEDTNVEFEESDELLNFLREFENKEVRA